ncbi:MAG: hypothetical protein A2655_00125 [Candidatus Yanofskybacteria bacterium RIFCSPHIGHO2_01_FULL_43_42]|uniref:Uncharacterized protein n=1 Tax=Candidatus Yanofskybacteria bacterium RIFCSPLOWO2_01_FULL_43_22 TaxID=1802695 RepID=A0A1F8GE85_9BACT|nr:MAG: hypothetical protein A2655_00125 [Candidatus Yanofskybacteria bacterium RIFCSPHIGHO2_01_FULL_43_42]OGN12555.1 MAG: hypothetical protein A3D48_04460 [Candidatus Yanofskybacteria bacterium RIFCSPHIGHO2_02_FULL_43_17]OGN23702.1 MAG: hypothetical protein A3A13_00120 [Candidatus Yanofskybacteria bacterium RIFCSPLOWO2_01_FULL_43_22]
MGTWMWWDVDDLKKCVSTLPLDETVKKHLKNIAYKLSDQECVWLRKKLQLELQYRSPSDFRRYVNNHILPRYGIIVRVPSDSLEVRLGRAIGVFLREFFRK